MRSWVENPTEGGRGGKEARGELVVWAELELETEFCTCPSNDEEAGFSWLRRSDPVQLMATFRLAAILCCGRRGPKKNESLEGRRKEIIELNICSLPSSSSSPTIFAFLSRFRSTCNTSSPASDPFSDLQDHPEISVARPTFPFVSHVSLLPLCTPEFPPPRPSFLPCLSTTITSSTIYNHVHISSSHRYSSSNRRSFSSKDARSTSLPRPTPSFSQLK